MAMLNSRMWRGIYKAEVIVLAAPVLLPMAFVALLGILYCSGATLIGVTMLPGALSGVYDDMGETLAFILLGSTATMTCVSGLAAMSRFRKVSMAYVFGPVSVFLEHGRKFRQGLLLAIAPMLFTTGLSVTLVMKQPEAWPLVPLVSGAVLIIPVTHLWLALREAERATISQTA